MADFRLISEAWERELVAARRANSSGLRIVCPFVKQTALQRIVREGTAKNIELITRFDLNCFDQGVSDIEALRAVLAAGGKVRGVRGLHAKLYLFGNASVIATSANVTEAAMRRNHEFGFAASDPAIVATCGEYFERLWKLAGADLTPAKLNEWEKILEARRVANPGKRKNALPDFGAKVPADSPFVTPTAATPSFANQAFVKFSGTGDNKASRDLRIDDVVAESGANWAFTYPSAIHPRQVNDGDVLYLGRLVHSPDDLMIFGKAIGREHRDDVDVASKAEIALRPWKENWANYVRVHVARFLDGTLDDGVSFRAMMAAMKSDSFASTQRHAAAGKGNIDPTIAYNRKPGMVLTDRSRAWIDERLENKLRILGEIDLSKKRFAPPGLPLGKLGYPQH
jgi:hypothetical protein